MKDKFRILLMLPYKTERIVLFICLNIVLIFTLYAIEKFEIFGNHLKPILVLVLLFSQSLIIKLTNDSVMSKECDDSKLINKNNEHDIDNKFRLLKEEINSDILQKLSGKIDADLEVSLKKHLDEKLDMNIVETLGERVQSVSSDFALAKRLSNTVEHAYQRIAELNAGYHALYKNFLKMYSVFGMLLAFLGVSVPFLCLWFHIEHIIHNDIEFIKNFKYESYLPIITFTFLCISLAITMFSLSAKAQEKLESYTKELNTLLMKATGARLLIETADKKQMIKAGEKFMEIERNFVLKKGERTIEQGNNELNISLLEKQNNMITNLITALGKSKKDT